MAEDEKKGTNSYRLYCSIKCFQTPSSPEQKHGNLAETEQKKPGGWRAMPFILGNETFERLATFGLLANFMVYLMRVFHLEQVTAANVLNIWFGVTNFAPLVGAFISDAYAGRYKTIAFASCAAFLGMVTVTLTAWVPYLHPKKCEPEGKQQSYGNCESPTSMQFGVLLLGLGFLSIGTGGIRPCSIPFGVDQFDPTTEEGRKGISSFYNWYYTSFTVVLLITLTAVVYVQDSVSWVLGFGIPTVLMLCSIILFFIGTRIYVHVKPEGSVFSGITQVFVSAYKKRRLKLPDNCDGEQVDGIFYDPPIKDQLTILSKLPLTNQIRFLNKAAMIEKETDLKPDGSCAKQWRLCSVQQVEEVKCLIKIGPIWASSIVSLTSMIQQGTFTVSQAMKMDRHLGEKFQIPASSIIVVSLITIGIWLPFYDRILVPAIRKVTKREGGITILQRIGIGIVFSVLSMVVAGLVERERRAAAISHPEAAAMSVFWLAPQLVVMGLCEAFVGTGQIEFYNEQFPDHMRSLGNSLFFCSFAGASYLSTMVGSIVHKVTGTRHHPDWLTNDLNSGNLDYFYFLLAGMGVVNWFYFLLCAHRYRYKVSTVLTMGDKQIPL
ncbi:PREDICTED: protein NRT1/ PTR FAMILY 2.13 [Populus euphratica]|uniref:Protein NRT1/ PTR FAMILY 2.13 n=1 Tax=Populus euphratica TaxID=75702 RepID=A0AAJ6X5Y8_POPEU|nr:PREDICTED: protein NRT1/ PTR FAMILY 2.13 [Populus euphratica]